MVGRQVWFDSTGSEGGPECSEEVGDLCLKFDWDLIGVGFPFIRSNEELFWVIFVSAACEYHLGGVRVEQRLWQARFVGREVMRKAG